MELIDYACCLLKWNQSDEGAIRQIKNNDYPHAIKDYGAEILLVGINYDPMSKEHSCTIERVERD